VSRTDIIRHDREKSGHPTLNASEEDELTLSSGEVLAGFEIETTDPAPVRDIMTPLVVSVELDESALEVAVKMLAFKLHRLLVVDDGVLVGVISTFDVLGKLRVEE
jgi:CBS domain-containing protein